MQAHAPSRAVCKPSYVGVAPVLHGEEGLILVHPGMQAPCPVQQWGQQGGQQWWAPRRPRPVKGWGGVGGGGGGGYGGQTFSEMERETEGEREGERLSPHL